MIDIRRPGLLVEIQTSSFGAMGAKLDRLLEDHQMLLVHPIPVEVYLQRPGKGLRRSPKRGCVHDVFAELVSIPTLLDHPNLELDVVLASVTVVQQPDRRKRRGRAGYRTSDRQLRQVLDVRRFRSTADLATLLPDDLPSEFTTADIAAGARVPRDLAQKMAFCFRALEVISEVGRSSAGIRYRLAAPDGSARKQGPAPVTAIPPAASPDIGVTIRGP